MYQRIGHWKEAVAKLPQENNPKNIRHSLVLQIRQAAKQSRYSINEGDSCLVCAEDIKDVLRKHHLILVSHYPHRKDLNDHLVILCENCHDIAHRLIYGDRGGITWQSVQKLKERGYWDSFVAIDKMAAEALLKGRQI
jgi:5-methylcytosine-specific restriction endonuclease McrA